MIGQRSTFDGYRLRTHCGRLEVAQEGTLAATNRIPYRQHIPLLILGCLLACVSAAGDAHAGRSVGAGIQPNHDASSPAGGVSPGRPEALLRYGLSPRPYSGKVVAS